MRGKKLKKRKPWPGHRYYTEYFMKHYDLWLNGEPTIDCALGAYLLQDEEYPSDDDRHRAIKDCVKNRHLDGVNRLEAIRRLREGGMELFVVGESRIEGITKDPKFRDESNRRLTRQLDQKKIATAKNVQGATTEQAREWGIPGRPELNRAKKRLLLGNAEAGVTVKK